jgi:hypothetical protein
MKKGSWFDANEPTREYIKDLEAKLEIAVEKLEKIHHNSSSGQSARDAFEALEKLKNKEARQQIRPMYCPECQGNPHYHAIYDWDGVQSACKSCGGAEK